eukprot:TRINITY_DN3129_c0_g1_i1.p1 TRINITY_DN3129_c0_g1~~TRINITY_DN3129_c0_g1_i1.p1  ORF type:complete len:113 (+),score=24.24 TRINITY_DN3129_c0_g1_i1:249-587(+)
MTEEGLQAIILLAEGDMRKCLNVLQSAHMAYDEVNKTNVYLCTGEPIPEDIRSIFTSLLNEPIAKAYRFIYKLTQEKGMALIDVLTPLVALLAGVDLSAPTPKLPLRGTLRP